MPGLVPVCLDAADSASVAAAAAQCVDVNLLVNNAGIARVLEGALDPDTDMTRGCEMKKSSPREVAACALDAPERGKEEVMADEQTQSIKAALGSEGAQHLAAQAAQP